MHSYKRADRVAELIQQEISRIVQEIKDPGLGFITITGVKVTDDLLDARIFYSVIGSEDEQVKSTEVLEKQLKSIRHELAERLNLRRTPVITFKYDDTAEKANRVFELLEKISREEPIVTSEPEKEAEEEDTKGE